MEKISDIHDSYAKEMKTLKWLAEKRGVGIRFSHSSVSIQLTSPDKKRTMRFSGKNTFQVNLKHAKEWIKKFKVID